ncbi:hypothetical protein BPOR_0902g00010 [Botrytis porri]|uniref:Uncharacterized protein n=1 Tax=Botrytis porri TaxID=87229 RepID=A0A4Z1KD86_9HELO|nr:hypothetical protein BPOR_0902g00010 [Botrytis porri]
MPGKPLWLQYKSCGRIVGELWSRLSSESTPNPKPSLAEWSRGRRKYADEMFFRSWLVTTILCTIDV